MNRTSIVGKSGSGKSTLSKIIENKTGLPLYHMDQLFWKGNWEPVPQEIYVAKHGGVIGNDKWIIEGYVDRSMADRLKRADLIIYLDYSGLFCFWRVLLRWLKHRKQVVQNFTRMPWDSLVLPY
jgi:adenylate kinase family enzyme